MANAGQRRRCCHGRHFRSGLHDGGRRRIAPTHAGHPFLGRFRQHHRNGNDIYADAPVGPNPWTAEAGPGVIETQIYNIVQNATSPNIFAILRDAVKLVNPTTSVDEIISITEAIVNGGMFLAAGPTAAHYTYDTHR